MQKDDRREWVRVSAETGDYLQKLSGRDDLLAVVEPGVGEGALAVYIPEKAHVEVNTDKCAEGVNPADVSMKTEVGRLKHPALTGACTHEGAHAMASKWELDQSKEMRPVVAAALLLEEGRAEKRMLAENPSERVFLRAGFHSLVAKEPSDPTTVTEAARLAALGLARIDAGVLDAAEMAPVRDVIVAVTGEDLLAALRAVWVEAQDVADDDKAEMERLGQKWLDLLPPEEQGEEGGITVIVCGMGGGEGEEGEEGEGSGNGVLQAVADAIGQAAEGEAAGQVEGAKVRDAAEVKGAETAEVKKSEKAAKAVFNKSEAIGHGHGVGGGEGPNGTTTPPVRARATANQLARSIQRAQFRERSKTVVPSAVPPGRLRGNVAIQRAAQRAQGIPVTAEPWRQTIRKHVDNPPLTVGVMVDISGSMQWAETPGAELAWALAAAIHKCDGQTATVVYGEKVHAVVGPGQHNPGKMVTWDATGGFENVDTAIRALDGALNLAGATGAKWLINISDGQYRHTQRESAEALLKRLTANGVHVLWIDLDGGGRSGTNPIRMPGVSVVKVHRGDDLGLTIGKALTKALNAA